MSKTAIGFTGAFFDPATYAYPLGDGYRWYLPSLVRFNAPDSFSPFGAGGVNPYAYCTGDPINHSDPSGHFELLELSVEGLEGMTRDVRQTAHASGSSTGQMIAAASAPRQGFDTVREQNLAAGAFSHWRQRVVRRKHTIHTMNALLLSMGSRVKTVDEFFDHFASGRVVVMAHADPLNYRYGHSSFYFNDETYDMRLLDDRFVRTRYKAKYPIYEWYGETAIPTDRSYIAHSRSVPDNEEQREAGLSQLTGKMRHVINLGHLFVLDKRYSEQFMLAFEQERLSFSQQELSYGLRYNCHTFVTEVLKRILDLSTA